MYARLFAAALVLCAATAAHAADLRVSLKELVSLLDPVLDKTRLRLHNVPAQGAFGGLFDTNQASYLRFGDTQTPLDIPAVTFPLTGIGSGRYAYYMNDIETREIALKSRAGELHLEIMFEDKDPELVAGCFSGVCGFTGALPTVEWLKPKITLSLKPVQFGNGITVTATKLAVNGYFKPVCRTGSLVCRIGRPWAERYINRLRSQDLPKQVLVKLNTEQNREKVAAQFARYLKLGPTGEVQVVGLSVTNSNVMVSFKLP